jgi:hypothetical protein
MFLNKLIDNDIIQPEFIVMDEYGRFFMGLIGGLPDFTHNIEDAKPLNNLDKFATLCRLCRGKELIYEYV